MIPFAKYHGCGNDFIILRETEADDMDLGQLARKVCHRNTGIGGDGMIVVRVHPELEMIFFNQDGSRAPMCGNGIRCFAKYCLDNKICRETKLSVKTLAGQMTIQVVSKEPFAVQVNMGNPIFSSEAFGVKSSTTPFLEQELSLAAGKCTISSCFMGTVHTVVFVDEFEKIDIQALGREISEHPIFAEKTNVNFVRVIDSKTLEVKTYERGAGLTYACGTGACASLVLGALLNRCDMKADVLLPLGVLHIEWRNQGDVYMTGPAERICQGVVDTGGKDHD